VYVENLSKKVDSSTSGDSRSQALKGCHSIEKGFDLSHDLREIHCEFKDVSHMSQVDSLHNNEVSSNIKTKPISTSTNVKVVLDVSSRTLFVTPSIDITTADAIIQCDLDKDVSKDSNTRSNNMYLSDSMVVLSGLRSASGKRKSSTTNRVSNIQQPVTGATRQHVSSKYRSANKTHRGMSPMSSCVSS
jgi:hypothetical protein